MKTGKRSRMKHTLQLLKQKTNCHISTAIQWLSGMSYKMPSMAIARLFGILTPNAAVFNITACSTATRRTQTLNADTDSWHAFGIFAPAVGTLLPYGASGAG